MHCSFILTIQEFGQFIERACSGMARGVTDKLLATSRLIEQIFRRDDRGEDVKEFVDQLLFLAVRGGAVCLAKCIEFVADHRPGLTRYFGGR